jgi:hypothetical protein
LSKQGDVSLPLVFNFALEYVIRKVQENQMRLKINGTHHLLFGAGVGSIFRDKLNTVKKITEVLTDTTKEVSLEVNRGDLSICSHHQNARKNHKIKKAFSYNKWVGG